ncbi:hypothetical protein QP196_10415 [Streptococcus agalactiae]|nr:hypothetical protein [Streptococcus agalactiae]MDK6266716.1 hypothetical protein [Streptococcus agalactiae]MDK6471449.1 hypothetical protein [Streptococcus agalactiae]
MARLPLKLLPKNERKGKTVAKFLDDPVDLLNQILANTRKLERKAKNALPQKVKNHKETHRQLTEIEKNRMCASDAALRLFSQVQVETDNANFYDRAYAVLLAERDAEMEDHEC